MADGADQQLGPLPRRVVLQPIDRTNWRRAIEVRVHSDQQRFVADHEPIAMTVLAKSYVRPGGLDWRPYIVMDGDVAVGVLALAFSERACELYHLAIDAGSQRRGFGTAALAAVVEMVKREHPGCRELSLTVHAENLAAQALYRARSFEPSGEIRHGEPVWRLALLPQGPG